MLIQSASNSAYCAREKRTAAAKLERTFGVEMDNSSMELINYFVARMEEKRHATGS